jgi:hypothetical protein
MPVLFEDGELDLPIVRPKPHLEDFVYVNSELEKPWILKDLIQLFRELLQTMSEFSGIRRSEAYHEVNRALRVSPEDIIDNNVSTLRELILLNCYPKRKNN